MTPYRCISADPPWPHRGGGGRGAQEHYRTLGINECIEVMRRAPCWRPDPAGCHLWLWVPNNWLSQGLYAMQELGFRYVTNLAWIKDRFGIGFYLRGKHELCLFGVMGRLGPGARDVPSAFVAARGRHSEKPALAYEHIERVSPGPRLEMFARKPRAGWDVWGNEVESAAGAA